MPSKKKQHYVPRFYLKRFSPNGRSINLWNIRSQKKILSAKLKNQCYKNYFYGKDLRIESTLGEIEKNASRILRVIDDKKVPPRKDTCEYVIFILYILMQYRRTEYSAEAINEMNDKTMKYLSKPMADAEGIDLSKVSIKLKNAAQYSLGLVTQNYPLLFDLECKLLINETKVEFVTSDNPIVLYNQLFSFRKFGSNTGLASKGLQIFFPISPNMVLIFYDAGVYRVGNRKNYTLYIDNPRDIHEINTLQMTSALENVYFHDRNFDIENLHHRASPFRRKRKVALEVFSKTVTEKEQREIISISNEDIRTNLSLSFVRLTRKAKKWKNNFLKLKWQPVTVVRNQQLFNDYTEFIDRVEKKEYKPSHFFLFLREKYGKSNKALFCKKSSA